MLKRMNLVLPVLLVAVLFAVSAVPALAMRPERTTIIDVALTANAETGEFSNLIAALTRVDTELGAGLIPLLDGNRQFTVFAPTDAAFDAAGQALGFADGADLVANVDVNVLLAVLTYHVAPGDRPAADVLSSERIRTVSKGFVFPYVDGNGTPFLRDSDSALGAGSPDAQIIGPNVFADNGVIHIIDWVLLP
ncbi:MAG: fasciclin domain-containing protein [Anaerolineae bacterium]|jgi:uncharacterized surface protein with fasciclin (FAS1) repeats